MRKISLFAAAAVLTLVGVGGWVASTTHARVEGPIVAQGIDPTRITMNAKNLPVEHFSDLTFIFN
jgi:hypothetical protein